MTGIKAPVPYRIFEEDLVSAEAQQDCSPRISIQFSPSKAFDFMMDPGCSLPNAKRANLSRLPAKGLFKEYRSKVSIDALKLTHSVYFISLLKMSCGSESRTLHEMHLDARGISGMLGLDLATSIHLNNSVTK